MSSEIIAVRCFEIDERGGETRGAQTVDSKALATKLKGAKAMRVERLLRKMEERAKRRQKRKEEVCRDFLLILCENNIHWIFSVGYSLS